MTFDDFWQRCPRKVAKGRARKYWHRIVERDKIATPEEIIAGMERFARHVSEQGTETRFIPHPATWLNDERWEDELETTYGNPALRAMQRDYGASVKGDGPKPRTERGRGDLVDLGAVRGRNQRSTGTEDR